MPRRQLYLSNRSWVENRSEERRETAEEEEQRGNKVTTTDFGSPLLMEAYPNVISNLDSRTWTKERFEESRDAAEEEEQRENKVRTKDFGSPLLMEAYPNVISNLDLGRPDYLIGPSSLDSLENGDWSENIDTPDLVANDTPRAKATLFIPILPNESNDTFGDQSYIISAFQVGEDNVRSMPSLQDSHVSGSLTGSSVFPKGLTVQSTHATSIDCDEVCHVPSAVTLYNYSTLNDTTVNQSKEDLESVKSLPDEALSQTGTLPGVARYQDVAARYIVKVLVEDPELLTMYEDAIQKTEKAKFVKNHEKLLHRFFLHMRNQGQVPSEISAIRFMARKTRRELISSEIYDIVAPSNTNIKAKLQIRLDREDSRAYMVARWLADQDSAKSATLAEMMIEPEPPEGMKDSGSDSDYEFAEKDALTKLECAAEFLVTGQPYQAYKKNLQAFLNPVSSRAKLDHELLFDKSPSQPTRWTINKRHNEYSDPAETQQISTDSPKYLEQGTTTSSSSKSKEQNPNSRLFQVQKTLMTSCRDFRVRTNLPMLVNSLMMYVPLPCFEPPVPAEKVRARWTCGCGTHLFDDFTELESGAVRELEAELQASSSHNAARSVRQAVHDASAQILRTLKQLTGQKNSQNAEKTPAEMVLPSYSTPANATEWISESGSSDLQASYLLLCVDESSSNTTLHQRKLEGMKRDRELFEFLQSQYFKLNKAKRWFTVRSFQSLSLSQFQVDYSNTADVYKHDKTCISIPYERRQDLSSFCVCLPPEEKIDEEYLCRPAPKKKLRIAPAIGPRKLTHYLLHPECINSEQESVLAQLPKRAGLYGLLKASPQEEVVGWGIHFEEGWHWPTIWFILAVLVSFSLLFGVIWSVKRDDIQGGFAVSGFVLASCGLIGGVVVYQ